jgi:uncharacterized membrane protein
METKVTSPVIKGLLIALVLILISVAAFATGQNDSSWSQWGSTLLLCGGVIASCIIYANQMNHNVTFGNVFAHGFKTGAVVTCIVIVFTVVFILLKPEIKEMAMEKARAEMEKNKNASEADIQKGVDIMKSFFYVITIGFILVMDLVISLISALIGAAVAKKNPNPTPFQ